MSKQFDIEYGKFHFCHFCRKQLSDEFAQTHKSLGHQVMDYLTKPKKEGYDESKKIQKTA